MEEIFKWILTFKIIGFEDHADVQSGHAQQNICFQCLMTPNTKDEFADWSHNSAETQHRDETLQLWGIHSTTIMLSTAQTGRSLTEYNLKTCWCLSFKAFYGIEVF